jgi:hypothetical protein
VYLTVVALILCLLYGYVGGCRKDGLLFTMPVRKKISKWSASSRSMEPM